MTDPRALILFAKFPRPGEVKTRLGKDIGHDQAAMVYRQLAERVFELGERAMAHGIQVFLFYASTADESAVRQWVGRDFHFFPQKGTSLGDRMLSAFETTFTCGAGKAAIIGTDIPDLDDTAVADAFAALDVSDVVIGPATDGGYYLLGMRSPARDLFSGIAWSTENVFRKTVDKITHLGLSLAVLRTLTDIDTAATYTEYIRRTSA